ncbi:MAG TPA: hypothetical protein VEQ65_06860 [Opitutus sp.]|nr:hypothetical protein [Opitutus sp.]
MISKKPTVSLEDLLKVKRAERPAPEFWGEFERELRVKQLAAIVEPRPWWAPFIRVGARLSHYQLPIGATAVLALSFLTVHEYHEPAAGRTDLAEANLPVMTAHSVARVQVEPLPLPVEQPSFASANASSAPSEAAAADATTVAASSALPESEPLGEPAATEFEPTPSAIYMAANLAAAQAEDPTLMDDVFGARQHRGEVREPVRDPLTHVTAPGEFRRSRLLATALPAAAGASDVPVGSSDRVARRLTEERLYDSFSRIGVQGDRVAIKF